MYVVDAATHFGEGMAGDNDLSLCSSSFEGRTSWHRENEIELFETSDCFAVSVWPQRHR